MSDGYIVLDVWGMTPAPQGSKSQTRTGHMYEANRNLPKWRDLLVQSFKARIGENWEPWDCPLECFVEFYIPKPRTTKFRAPMGKPDTDKLQRAIGDALTIAKVIRDDSRIIHWDARKRWTITEAGAGIILRQVDHA